MMQKKPNAFPKNSNSINDVYEPNDDLVVKGNAKTIETRSSKKKTNNTGPKSEFIPATSIPTKATSSLGIKKSNPNKVKLPEIKPDKAKGSKAEESETGRVPPERIIALGKYIAENLKTKDPFPKVTSHVNLKPDVLPKMVAKIGQPKEKEKIDRVFRAAHKGEDELFSTATTRNIVLGLYSEKEDAFTIDEFEHLTSLIDIVSNMRIPTKYSGYSTEDSFMQHPTRPGTGTFGDAYDSKSGSLHSNLDAKRQRHVVEQMEEAVKNGKSGAEVIIEGAIAAGLFTLYEFTAPSSAKDVFPHLPGKEKDVQNKGTVAQVGGRDRIKLVLKQLGVGIQDPPPGETEKEALERPWNKVLPEMNGKRIIPKETSPLRIKI